MQDSKFWKIMAIVFCAGLFYVGYGLQQSGSVGTPFFGVAHAGGAGVDTKYNQIYTSSADGKTLYRWRLEGLDVTYVGMVTAKGGGISQRPQPGYTGSGSKQGYPMPKSDDSKSKDGP